MLKPSWESTDADGCPLCGGRLVPNGVHVKCSGGCMSTPERAAWFWLKMFHRRTAERDRFDRQIDGDPIRMFGPFQVTSLTNGELAVEPEYPNDEPVEVGCSPVGVGARLQLAADVQALLNSRVRGHEPGEPGHLLEYLRMREVARASSGFRDGGSDDELREDEIFETSDARDELWQLLTWQERQYLRHERAAEELLRTWFYEMLTDYQGGEYDCTCEEDDPCPFHRVAAHIGETVPEPHAEKLNDEASP